MRNLPKFTDPNLIVGAEHFSDAGVYRLRDDLWIVQSLDFFPPLVDDPHLFGQIAAANSLSDIYAMGATPTTALNIVGFPDDQLELDVLGEILRGGAEQVARAGAVIVGGHTVRDVEIKYGLSVTGVVTPERLFRNSGARPGDLLVLTKAVGTGFVTTAFKAGRCPDAAFQAACASMAQLNAAARDAAHSVQAHAVTDITGFGLVGHAGEMAQASGVTLCLDVGRVPRLPGADVIAARGNRTRASGSNREFASRQLRIEHSVDEMALEFLFDPQTSGGLLISVAPQQGEQLVQAARDGGAEATCIVGSVSEARDVAVIIRP